MSFEFAAPDVTARPLIVLEPDEVALWAGQQSDRVRHWVEDSTFRGSIGSVLMIPGETGAPEAALVGYGTAAQRRRTRFALAAAVPNLADGTYALTHGIPGDQREEERAVAALHHQ